MYRSLHDVHPPARGLRWRSTRPTAPARCARPGSRRRRGRRSATSDATTRCSPRWRSMRSPARCSPASRPSRATSPGCARSTRPGRASSAAVVPVVPAARHLPPRAVLADAARWSSTRDRPKRTPSAHIPGSLSIPAGTSFGTWLGWVRTTIARSCWSSTTPTNVDDLHAPGPPDRPRDDRRVAGGRPARRGWRPAIPSSGRRRPTRSNSDAGSTGDPAERRSSSTSGRPPSTRPATSRAPSTSARVPWPTSSTSCPGPADRDDLRLRVPRSIAASILRAAGFDGRAWVRDGFDAWAGAGHPHASGGAEAALGATHGEHANDVHRH